LKYSGQKKDDFRVVDKNIPCHIDIANSIKQRGNGLFTFTLRVNSGCIMDYVDYSNPTASEYSAIFNASETKCEISRSSGSNGSEDELR
jgi:hypothetical protein